MPINNIKYDDDHDDNDDDNDLPSGVITVTIAGPLNTSFGLINSNDTSSGASPNNDEDDDDGNRDSKILIIPIASSILSNDSYLTSFPLIDIKNRPTSTLPLMIVIITVLIVIVLYKT